MHGPSGPGADFCRFGLVSPSTYILRLIPKLNKFHKQTNFSKRITWSLSRYSVIIALLAQRLFCEELVDLKSIEELVECWLIPLDKSSGNRPIVVGQVLQHIIGKAIMTVL